MTDGLNTEQPADSADIEARLAVVNNLIKLCNRSYYPGATLMNAFRQYDRLVADDEKLLIFSPDRGVRLSNSIRDFSDILRQMRRIERKEMQDTRDDEKKDDQKLDDDHPAALDADPENSIQDETEPSRNELDSRDIPDLIARAYLRATGATIEEQSKQELQQKLKSIKQELLPLFIRWQPYGVLLKLAQLYKLDITGYTDTELRWPTGNPINLLIAPELSDIEMIASDDKSCFMQSEKNYQRVLTTQTQHIADMIKRHNFLRKRNGLVYGAYEPLTRSPVEQFERDLRLFLAFQIFHLANEVDKEENPDTKNRLVHELIQTLLQLDQATDGEFAIREVLDPATAWSVERLGTLRAAPVNELFKCLESLMFANTLFYRFDVPAAFCDRIAWLSNDPVIQEKFLKKSVFFWDKCLKNITDNGMLNRLNLIRDGMLTYYRASQSITDPSERARCYRTAVKLKWLAAIGRLLSPNIFGCCSRQ